RPGGLRLVRYNRHLLSHQGVQQRGLPGVGPPDQRHESRLEMFTHCATVCDLLIRTCSTRNSSEASTSMRTPSRSTNSPALGTRPNHSLTSPPTVVDSISSSRWNEWKRSSTRSTSKLPETMYPPCPS